MTLKSTLRKTINRRKILQKGMAGLGIAGIGASIFKPSALSRVAEAAALAEANGKILVILVFSQCSLMLSGMMPRPLIMDL